MTTKTPEPASFSTSLDALETILEQFKSSSLPLEESLSLFEQGVGHIKVCQEHLGQARGKVEMLVKTLQEDGEIATVDFDESP